MTTRQSIVSNAYYILNSFIFGEIRGSYRFKHIRSEEDVIKFFVDNNCIDEFRNMQFNIDYRILLFPKLFRFIKLIHTADKILIDIIQSINKYPNNHYYDLTGDKLHDDILKKIPLDQIVKWYNDDLIRIGSVKKYFTDNGMEYLLNEGVRSVA